VSKIKKLTFFTNDTRPIIQMSLIDEGGDPIDLTPVTNISLYVRLMGSTASAFTATDCSVSVATAGTCTYSLPSAFTDAGMYEAQAKILFSDGKPQRTERFHIQVENGRS
jgi:hypothetical protein